MDKPTETTEHPAATLESLRFRYPFRKYQRMILSRIDKGLADHKFHIIAPPGAGKTIVGIELIRQLGVPAVVFAPTTTIQQQWQEKVSMFTEHPEQAASLTSQDPAHLAPINIFTYQLISTPGQAQEFAQQIALEGWVDDLLAEAQLADEGAARARIDTLHQNNPQEYAHELSRRYLRVKKKLLTSNPAGLSSFLHPHARELIQRLVEYGVRTVVLDECHHLLDYWALALRYLTQQINDVRVIGLTATLPDPEDEREYENYTGLVGGVDFEVPTPAVVKEGDLAPYRDLVYFVEPTERENSYLHDIQSEFEEALARFTSSPSFVDWVRQLILLRPGPEGQPILWENFLEDQPLLSLAGIRLLVRVGYPIPSSLPVPLEANEPMEMDDWLVLLEKYALNVLKVSADTADHHQLADLRHALLPFGLTITERGLRHGRSPGDLVLALSEAKDAAVATILAAESAALGDRLRAVVVTDFETMASGVQKRLHEVLEPDAGSALRVFRYLSSLETTQHLHPVLVTGSKLMVAIAHSGDLLDYFNGYLAAQGLKIHCTTRETTDSAVAEVTGDGGDWSSRIYVSMVTATLEVGLTRCVVGTRGIFGEGWDALTLNTLIDLTGVTTSTAVQQLRGRGIRLDPSWPRKVAHNWDVVCVAPAFKEGDGDLKRFERRHDRYWGVSPIHPIRHTASYAAEAPQSPSEKRTPLMPAAEIVKGVAHVNPGLAWDLARQHFDQVNYPHYNELMMAEVGQRDHSYDMWGIGQDYDNSSYSTERLQASNLKIHTAFTLKRTLKAMLNKFLASIVICFVLLFLGTIGLVTILSNGSAQIVTGIGAVALVAAIISLVLNGRSAYRLGKALLVEQAPDDILLDVGRATFAALRDAELVSRNLREENIRVAEQPDYSYRVVLESASPQDTAIFTASYSQVFAPIRDQRYLILRDDTRLPSVALAPIWLLARLWFGQYLQAEYKPAYYPVPALLAARKERAEAFARYWSHYIGGGNLIFTRSEEGRRVLLQARTQRRPEVKSLSFDVWR